MDTLANIQAITKKRLKIFMQFQQDMQKTISQVQVELFNVDFI